MRIKYNGTINASSDKDYASLKGTDFDKAKTVLTKDGYKEHEYGDKDDNNGYAVYRKGDKEVELTYEWIKGKRNGEAHAGKVLDVYVDDNINGACGNKRSVKAAYDNEDIVMYWDGQKVYEGPVDSNMTREIVWFLDDPEKLQEIVDYCNSFGDPVIEDTSNLMDVAATFVEMVDYELKEANSIDDDVYISDEAGHFEIFEKSKEVTGAKKSVKCSTDGNVPYDLVSMLVALRDYADVSDAYVSDEHGKLVDIADSLYNVGEEVVETMKPEFKKVYEKYGKDYFDTVLDDVSALDSQLTRNNVNDLIADYEDRANNFNGVKGACGGKKSLKGSAIMAGPGAGYTIKWNLESIDSINSFNVTNVSEPDQYGLITAEADCDVDVTVEIVEAYSYYYGIDSPINGVPAKMTKVKFEIDPDQWPELGSFYDAGVDFAAEFLNNEIYDTISNGEVMYGGGWSHSTWDGTLTDYEHDGLIEIKVTDQETIDYVDDAVSGAFEYDDEYDAVEESKRNNSVKTKRRRITAAEGSFEANVEKIKYYASKVMEDINAAAQIFQNSGESWTPIEVPDVYVKGDEQLFYEWYVQNYVDFFDDVHPNGGEITKSYSRNGTVFNVSYGYFNSKDLYNYGDNVESLIEFVEGFNYMENLYMVTFEYGFTIQDLATDPYKVFNDFDDEDKLYYSEEVLAEFDLWTQSDRQYDLAKDAQGIVNLYKEVSDYFSYDNAKQAAQEFNSGYDDDIEGII